MPALSLQSRKCAYRKNVTDGLKRVLFIVASPDMARNDSKPVSMRAKVFRDFKHSVLGGEKVASRHKELLHLVTKNRV